MAEKARACLTAALTVVLATGSMADSCDPEAKHREGDQSNHQAVPNPDPAPQKTLQPPTGVYVTFLVTWDTDAGKVIITYNVGDKHESFTSNDSGHQAWGTVAPLGTQVYVLAAHVNPGKRGRIAVSIKREPGGHICDDNNEVAPTGGADCGGVV